MKSLLNLDYRMMPESHYPDFIKVLINKNKGKKEEP